MKTPITIHPMDTPEQARDRHLEIQKRLDELGAEAVRLAEFPPQWNLIVAAWLKGDRLDDTDGHNPGR